MTDTTTLRVRALVLGAASEAYGPPAEPCRCAFCGRGTDTRDGYQVPTPLGDVWVCPFCNRDPLLWDPAETFFTGAVKEARNG